jgi:hypothetical protein
MLRTRRDAPPPREASERPQPGLLSEGSRGSAFPSPTVGIDDPGPRIEPHATFACLRGEGLTDTLERLLRGGKPIGAIRRSAERAVFLLREVLDDRNREDRAQGRGELAANLPLSRTAARRRRWE